MAKGSKSGGKSAAKPAGADHHRKMAQTYSAKARLHSAKAELIDAQNPKKKPGPYC